MDEVAERVSPAIVQIWVSGFGTATESRGGESVIERQRSIGSGVIVDPDGYIVTNAHVIAGAHRIRVSLSRFNAELVPGQTSFLLRKRNFDATLVGTHSLTDLALLKIDAKDLPYLPLKSEFSVRLGQTVLALGSPEGLEHTITRGIVSAVGRQPELDRPMIYIQTDAPINPGNSGGALVNRDGDLVGINTFILSKSGGSEGLGFAVPQPTVRFVYEELKQYGRVRRTVIGANAQTITPTLAAGLKLPQDWGVVISDVFPGGPADAAGLRVKDVVVAIDNRNIDSLPRFTAALYLHAHDRPVEIEVLRAFEKLKFRIKGTDAPNSIERLSDLIDPKNGLVSQLGIFAIDLDKQIAESIGEFRSPAGVLVAGKADVMNSIQTDLKQGDLITAVNGVVVASTAQLRSELERLAAQDPVVLRIERQGVFQYLSFEVD
jgi:serine protease Do